MSRYNRYLLSFSAIGLILIVYLGYFANRASFEQVAIPFGLLFAVFGLQYSLIKHSGLSTIALWSAIVFRAALLFSLPNLSDDFYRFIWDGSCLIEGENPFAILPSAYINSGASAIQQQVFPLLNSQGFYTVYPPVSQLIFGIAAFLFPHSILGQVGVMKLFILLFELGSISLLIRLLKHFKRPRHLVYLYALNPLVIIELSGNIHFEAAMLFFLLLGIWLWVKHKPVLSGLVLAAAICTKFWPLFMLPFFFNKKAIKQSLLFYVSVFFGVGVLTAMFWFDGLATNIYSSLSLYFSYFEFNAGIYYLFGWLSEVFFQTNYIKSYPIILHLAFCFSLLLFFVKVIRNNKQDLAKYLLFALSAYLLLATTVHPWYVIPLIALALLSGYYYPMVWSVLIPITYYTYSNHNYSQPLGWIALEYAILYGTMLFEIAIRPSSFWHKLMQQQRLKRAEIKLLRIENLMGKNDRLLDIGTGNGALAHLLKQKGYAIETVDVGNKSTFEAISPTVYDGKTLPFKDNHFDTVLIITVLHHSPQPEAILKEARRVGKLVIVMEDIYSNTAQKYLTYITDSLVNNEFWGHPHTNKTDGGWRAIFKKLNFNLLFSKEKRFLLGFTQVTYKLMKNELLH